MSKCIFSLLLICVLAGGSPAQSVSSFNGESTRIKDDKADISILFPANFLVDTERPMQRMLVPAPAGMLPGVKEYFEKPRVIGTLRSVRVDLRVIQMRQVSSAKEYLWLFAGPNPPKDKTQDFVIGDFVGRRVVDDTDRNLIMTIAIAFKARIFVVHIKANNEDQALYQAFLTSLMVNGKPLFTSSSAIPLNEAKNVLISQLQTSPEVLEALKQKQQKSEILVSETNDSTFENDGNVDFSRQVITLRHSEYFGENNFPKGVKMPINIRATFLATGKIGGIVIPSGMPKSFAEAVRKSATEVRFLPAEVNGKKVDASLVVKYPPMSTSPMNFFFFSKGT